MKRVIKVTFNDNKENFLFKNRKDIFKKFSKDKLGITYQSLCNVTRKGETFKNKKVMIEETQLLDID